MRFIARLTNLVRGTLAQWLGRREHRNPEAVYEAAIGERMEQYVQLRGAAAGVIYMRGKLARELEQKSGELKRFRAQLEVAVDRDDDAVAMALIGHRDACAADVDRISAELAELTTEAEAAKQNLIAFQDDIARLREEKVRMMARLANARARLRLQETFRGMAPDADIHALEAVREHISKLVAEVQLSREVENPEMDRRIGRIRDAESTAARRAELDELKRERRRTLLPVVLPRSVAVG